MHARIAALSAEGEGLLMMLAIWDSGAWQDLLVVAGIVVGAYLLVMWIAALVWTYRDAQSRSRDPFTQNIGLLLVLVFNFPGLLLYLVLRPRDTLLEIDWQGAQQVREVMPQAVSIFIVPPSIAELERRLRARGQDSEEVIQRRVAAALGELRHVDEFDFVIINKDLQEALEDLAAAVRASRLNFARQKARHPEVFRFLSSH